MTTQSLLKAAPLPAGWRRSVQIGLLVLMSLQIYVVWAILLAQGAFAGPFVRATTTGIPFFHLCAEFLMASVTLVGALGWWRGAPWGRGVTLVGLGMFAYGTINAMGWAMVNSFGFLIPMAVGLVIIAATTWTLTRPERDGPQG